MSRYRRPELPGATIFFTVNLAQRGSDLLTRHIDPLRMAVALVRRDHPFAVLAWVVLPDHMHCIWELPEGDSGYSLRMAAIKGHFSRRLRSEGLWSPTEPPMGARPARGEVGLWQKRFWEHHIRNGRDLDAHLDYCRCNPVKHGLVADPKDWPFSSFNRRSGLAPTQD